MGKAVASHKSLVFVSRNETFGIAFDATPIGLVENFTAEKMVMSENFQVIGSRFPPDNTINMEHGRISWSRVYTPEPFLTRIITPRIAEYCSYDSFTLLVMNYCGGNSIEDLKPIALAVGCLPEALGILLSGGRAARSSYTGLCRYILLETEILAPPGERPGGG